jgi:hypothetical protein
MALAIRLEQLIKDGLVTHQAELARVGHVSRARVTQIMNLLNLAPTFKRRFCFFLGLKRVEPRSPSATCVPLPPYPIGALKGGCGLCSRQQSKSLATRQPLHSPS